MSSIPEMFKNQKYVVFNDVISHEMANLMTDYLFVKRDAGLLVPPVAMGGDDSQCPLSWSIYGDSLFDTLLARLAPQLSNLIGVELVPAYTYSRIYQTGEELKYHKDRPSCEISGTLTLGRKQGEPIWPIYVGRNENDTIGNQIDLDVGEMLLYRGCDVPHWRPVYKGEWQAQVFVHYVDANGPYAEECKFDGRPALGIPKTQQIATKQQQNNYEKDMQNQNNEQKLQKPWLKTQEETMISSRPSGRPLPKNFEFKVGE